jgi:hypothetical protein
MCASVLFRKMLAVPDEVSINDMREIALHLTTHGTDFDPSGLSQSQVDLAIRGDRERPSVNDRPAVDKSAGRREGVDVV